MRQYLDLLQQILDEGTWQSNRTGIDAISIPGAMLRFDLNNGFPAVTTKKLFFGAVKGELLGFLRGFNSAAQFRELGCKIWDQNANENKSWLANPNRKGEDDLGRVYGVQWRDWRGKPFITKAEPVSRDLNTMHFLADVDYVKVDQLHKAIETIKNDPTNRRIIVSAWRPDELDQMALPPCHLLFQFIVNVEKKELNLCWYQRSCDVPIGIPFNIASYALLLAIIAQVTGYKPRFLTGFLADTHIYRNQLDAIQEQMQRVPYALPSLDYSGPDLVQGYADQEMRLFDTLDPAWWNLENYQHHAPIKMDMAV